VTDRTFLTSYLSPEGILIEARAVETKPDLPPTYTRESGIFGYLAHNGSRQLALVPPDERLAVLDALGGTLWRAAYHRRRVDQYVDIATARFRELGKRRVCGDSVALGILFEAQAFLVAARAFVEEVMYMGSRRAGASPDKADERATKELALVKKKRPATLPEAVILALHHSWFEELTEYRNALVHRGAMHPFGFVPRGVEVPQADDPKFNVRLMPDLASIERPNRPSAWTFKQGRKLDLSLRAWWDGLLAYARDVGECWGFNVTSNVKGPVGSEHGSVVMLVPRRVGVTRKVRR
jgi:hypothetical protein